MIKNAKVKHEKVVFTVSTKEINLLPNPTGNLKLLTVIPQGTFLGMRFDIDALSKTRSWVPEKEYHFQK